ncbi:hypothetical protein DYB32_002370 [Aphanomyces invadans]|uniref:Tudor-knot domain-containing protein n=1 Tax=Aphanomyces invadans TaxID=157072 RepID=A0A3R6VQJ1_9STRA|nr:hypothetical protein DYB32_002370 [Aphanomyces invadans]
MIDTSAPPSKKKEEKYMGLGVMVDCKDDQGHWNQGRIIDVNVSARLLKIHYSGWHKRYDNWMPLSSIVAHGSRVKNATLTPQSLKQTNLRSNLFRLNPNYVERNPSKLPAAPLAPSRQLSKESETSAAAPTTLSPQLPVPPVIQKSNKRTASGAPVVPLSVPSANPAQDVSKPNKKPRVGAIHESESLVEAASPRSNPVTSDSPIPSKSTLAEIFRNRVRDQQLQPLAFKQRQAPPTQQLAYRGGPPISAKERKQNRASNLMYMEHQEAFLRESIQRWTQVQQDLIKDVTSVVVL